MEFIDLYTDTIVYNLTNRLTHSYYSAYVNRSWIFPLIRVVNVLAVFY
jgi:hypothetical protein